jgi:hypothetical protein
LSPRSSRQGEPEPHCQGKWQVRKRLWESAGAADEVVVAAQALTTVPPHRDNKGMKADAMDHGHDLAFIKYLRKQPGKIDCSIFPIERITHSY